MFKTTALLALVAVALGATDTQLNTADSSITTLRNSVVDLEASAISAKNGVNTVAAQLKGTSIVANGVSNDLAAAQQLNVNTNNAIDSDIMDELRAIQARVDNMDRLGQPFLKNAKECSIYAMNDGRDSGTYFYCPFEKKYDNTVLKLSFLGNARVICNGCTRYYRININDDRCYAPAEINSAFHETSNNDNHRGFHLIGYCTATRFGPIERGTHLVSMYTHGSGDAYMGWESSNRLIIEEVPAANAEHQLQSRHNS
jgi:hypothetical protein